MPASIRKLASKYLTDPEEITIKQKTASGENIRQRCLVTYISRKFDALSRILETEKTDGVIIFAATKTSTVELTEKLEAVGHTAVALNGDITQKLRERTVNQFKKGNFDILVATDVAARGLDVDRVSHVINYDAPFDSESYIHRIGRTGRAGRSGEAILFITPKEKRLLHGIERTARQKLQMMELPTVKEVNEKRISRFKERISETIANQDLSFYNQVITEFRSENEVEGDAVAAALAHMVQGDTPLLLPIREQKDRPTLADRRQGGRDRGARKPGRTRRQDTRPESGMERFRVDVGHDHGVKPGNLVGAIANEAGLDSEFIGRINIYPSFSTVDLPEGIPRNVFNILKKSRVAGRPLRISKYTEEPGENRDQGYNKPSRRPDNRRAKLGFDRKQQGGKAKGAKVKPSKVFRRAL